MKKTQRMRKVERSSGNVFADLGLADPSGRLVKAQLADEICRVIAEQGLTQRQAAEVVGLDQPKISALMNGRLKGFSTERLMQCLNALSRDVVIAIRPAAKAPRRGETRVVAAAM